MHKDIKQDRIIIVGGGLVGTLNAIFFAQSNRFDVILLEKKADIRKTEKVRGRSINLSLSHRGLGALEAVGLEDTILKYAVPMYGRMIHDKNRNLKFFPYSNSNDCLWSVDRKLMNEILLTETERYENVAIQFESKIIGIDLVNKIARFSKGNEMLEMQYDLLIGNDGAHSTVRQVMSKSMRFDFSQEYIPHGYIELRLQSGKDKSYLMKKNCLHLWPRNEFMLISFPNLDGSYTGTLFMPFEKFDAIKTKEDLFNFFEENFSDALEIIEKENLNKMFWSQKPCQMISIWCKPYNYEDSCVLMGDAAHAMVPFYGQGMNCGFEDLIIFHDILKGSDFNLGKTCHAFSENRNKDARAICELAFYNYVELRKNVTSKSFLWRKMFDNLLNFLFPESWIPLYSMVCFTRMPYTKCVEEKNKQDKILSTIRNSALFVALCGAILGTAVFIKTRFSNF